MIDKYENKAMKPKKINQKIFFPHIEKVIEAENIKDAEKKLKNIKDEPKKNNKKRI